MGKHSTAPTPAQLLQGWHELLARNEEILTTDILALRCVTRLTIELVRIYSLYTDDEIDRPNAEDETMFMHAFTHLREEHGVQ
jgi:hypothetical protein